MQKSRVAFLLIVSLLLGACVPKAQPSLPTIAVLPTDTITPSPTITLTPTITPSPTDTPTYTLTPTDTPTYTLTPSITPSPTETFTITPSYTPSNTATLTPSDTPTDTDTPTITPSNTRTPTNTRVPTNTRTPTALPVIASFTADSTSVISGNAVTLHWKTNADKVTIDQITSANAVIQSGTGEANGQKAFTVTADHGRTVTFRLTANKGTNKPVTQTVSITVTCTIEWFFTPAPDGCPSQAAQSGSFIFQAFERGVAFYVYNDSNIYFLANNRQVSAYPNQWTIGQAMPSGLVPPSGFIDPQAQIGYTWHTRNWPDNNTLITTFGWATTQQESYSGMMQQGTKAGEVYLRRPDGAVYKITLVGFGDWEPVH